MRADFHEYKKISNFINLIKNNEDLEFIIGSGFSESLENLTQELGKSDVKAFSKRKRGSTIEKHIVNNIATAVGNFTFKNQKIKENVEFNEFINMLKDE